MSEKKWKVGDRVWFAAKPLGRAYKVARVSRGEPPLVDSLKEGQVYRGEEPSVELEGMAGVYPADIFVACTEQCPTCGGPVVTKKIQSAGLAEGAYSAYGRSTGNKNFRGEQMPEWKDLPESIRTAWGAAVRFVFDQVA